MNFVETCLWHVLGYLWGDRNMPLPCFRIHGVAIFPGIETTTMAPIKNLTMEKNKRNLGRM
jgi:hypothetical protein